MLGKTLLVIAVEGGVMLGLAGAVSAHDAPSAMTNAEVLAVYIQVNSFDLETALLGRAQGNSSARRGEAGDERGGDESLPDYCGRGCSLRRLQR
jgi:hypothetical protein